jgi:hypothetical protein
VSKLIIGLGIAGTVWVASGVAFVVLLLIEARKATPRVRHRLAEAPEWLRTHAPETGVSDWLRSRDAGDSSAELAALRDELREIRAIVGERVPADAD